MSRTLSLISLLIYLLQMPAACAITLTNHNAKDQKITVIEGEKQTDQVIKPSEKVEVCQQGCVIHMPDGEDYEFDGTELVVIEDDILMLDVPDEQAKSGR